MDTLTFAEFQRVNLKRALEWQKGEKLSLSFRGNELAGEAGEACNVIKKMERARLGLAVGSNDIDHLKEEVADVVICAMLIANELDFDLGEAVRRKFNKTSDKYGLATKL